MEALEVARTYEPDGTITVIVAIVVLFLLAWAAIRFFDAFVRVGEVIPKIGDKITILDNKAYPFVNNGDTATVGYWNVKYKTVGVLAGNWPNRDKLYKAQYPDDTILIFGIEEVDRAYDPPDFEPLDEMDQVPEKKIDMGIQGVQEFEDAMEAASKELAELVGGDEVKPMEPAVENRQQQEASSHLGYDAQEASIAVIDPPKSNRLIALEAANANRKATAYVKAECILIDIGEGMSLQDAADKYDFANVKYLVRSVRKQGLEDPREVAKRVQASAKAQESCESAQGAALNAG